MTVQATYFNKSLESDSESSSEIEDDYSINNENVSPCTGELMVAVKPSTSNSNSPLNTKINISTPNKKTSLEAQKLIISRTIASPVKRPFNSLDVLTLDAPLAKRSSTPTSFNSVSSESSNSPVKLLSQSAGSSQLQSAINRVKTSLSQSCFADLRAGKGSDIDSDLTCLSWLQEGSLLNGFNPGSRNAGSVNGDIKTEVTDVNHPDYRLNSSDPLNAISEEDKALRKPAYSFSTLIFMAIENAKDKRLPVKDIYQWIQDNFPYFQKAPIGWKNSVRHNLSLNKSFKKVDKEKCIGKGSLWTIDHEARAGLVQQLRKTTTYHSYPYSRTPYPHACSRYFMKDKTFYKRDHHGRFVPNHDDTEFDVAAAMCSMSTPSAFKNQRRSATPDDGTVSAELLQIWRTYIEPYNGDICSSRETSPYMEGNKFPPIKVKYSIEDFLDVVQTKLSFKSGLKIDSKPPKGLNTSMDEDYEFYNSDDDSDDDDDEMNENMKRLVEKEKDDGLGDSGYSEEGTFKNTTMLDHSYSKSISSLVRPHTRRESKGVAALLHLANAASRELESLNKQEKKLNSNLTKTENSQQNDVDIVDETLNVKLPENTTFLTEVNA